MKKSVTGISFLIMAMVAANGMVSIQAANTQDTTVTYKNSSEIGDDPDWAVTIPVSITIDEKTPNSTFKVEAISKADGEDISTVLDGKTVEVAITSKNDFTLKYNDSDPVDYELDKQNMELTSTSPSDTATVSLKGIAAETGDHTDVLTFTLTTTTNP